MFDSGYQEAICVQPLFVPELMGKRASFLYFRGDYKILEEGGGVYLSTRKYISSETYFNALSLDKWYSKTSVRNFWLSLKIHSGEGNISLIHKTLDAITELGSYPISSSSPDESFSFSIESLEKGIVFWVVKTETQIILSDIKYETRDTPLRSVKIGLVIPAFHRDDEVKDAIDRFNSSALPAQGHDLFVIDNGGTLSGDKIIQNNNLGASGGFTRGLIEVRRDPTFTHALFMDDDAPSPMLCIEKTAAFLQFAHAENTAIAGSMLIAETPSIQCGAGLKFHITTADFLKADWDMADPANVLRNELDEPIDVGAWYFFAFPVNHFDIWPFPYFIRGDDVLFSLQNHFDVVTITGIACWQSSFDEKESPSIAYLTYRARFLTGCLMSERAEHTIFDVFNEIIDDVRTNARSFRYGDAHAILDAIEDVLKGPIFFEKKPSAIERLAEISNKYKDYYPRRIEKAVVEQFANDGDRIYVAVGFEVRPNFDIGDINKILFISQYGGTYIPVTRSDSEDLNVQSRVRDISTEFSRSGIPWLKTFNEHLPYIQSEKFWREALQLIS
ncbi:hypothetical protein [Consotaella aegiceratis]|uniref:hypothetical protein n=1 Tax=Consotaella aegiceratis TaxID=3097961 RepID=UPI002F3EAEB2